MFRFIWSVIKIVWAISIIGVAIFVGAAHGLGTNGLTGAIALGFCGLVFGSLLACSPLAALEIFLSAA